MTTARRIPGAAPVASSTSTIAGRGSGGQRTPTLLLIFLVQNYKVLLELPVKRLARLLVSAGEIGQSEQMTIHPDGIHEGVRPLVGALGFPTNMQYWPRDETNHIGKDIGGADILCDGLQYFDPNTGSQVNTVGNKQSLSVAGKKLSFILGCKTFPDKIGRHHRVQTNLSHRKHVIACSALGDKGDFAGEIWTKKVENFHNNL
jgi:hypothetical protein